MIKLLYFTTVYYKKNKKSRYTILSLTILFLLITNLFYQYTKSIQYSIKLSLSNNMYQLSKNDHQTSFLKRFVLHTAAKYIEEQKIGYDYNINDYSLVLKEENFLRLVKNNGFNQKTLNLNNSESYQNLKKELNKKLNLFIKNESIIKLNYEKKIFLSVTKTLTENQVLVLNYIDLLNYINDTAFLTIITQNDDIISLKIEKNFINTLSLNQIILLNFFILCLPLFFPYLLTILRKLRSFN